MEEEHAVELRVGRDGFVEISRILSSEEWGTGVWKPLFDEGTEIPSKGDLVRIYCPGKGCRGVYMKSQGRFSVKTVENKKRSIGKRYQHRSHSEVSKCTFPAQCILLDNGAVEWNLHGVENKKWDHWSNAPKGTETLEERFLRVYGSELKIFDPSEWASE